MSSAIEDLMSDPGPDVYYEEGFRNVLEDHMTYLREHAETIVLTVTPKQTDVYQFDLIGLLNELNVPMYLHWVIMRMNHLNTITQVPADLTGLLSPKANEISKLEQTYSTTYRIQ